MPEFEQLREADFVLNACGRPVPPPGYRFVDLPRAVPFQFNVAAGVPGTPFNRAVTNKANTQFHIRGLAAGSGSNFLIRIKWPSGRYLSQNFFWDSNSDVGNTPIEGRGGMLWAFPDEIVLDPDGRVTVEIISTGPTINFQLWGFLRYLIKQSSGRSAAPVPGSATSCIVGYPVAPKSPKNGALQTIPDPWMSLVELPRYRCDGNGNIMAPEFRLGNQCTAETPEGYQDESFTFSIDPIAIASGTEVLNNALIVPGGGEDVVLKTMRAYATFTGGGFSAVPVVQVRLPNGYSITRGDFIPVVCGDGQLPNTFELPLFPTLRIPAGQRIIIDAADMLVVAGPGTTTLRLEFDGVKRRKVG